MLLSILAQTPKWVFFLFAALLWLGMSQMFTRNVRLGRVLGVAIGMMAFSLYGTVAAFGASDRTLALALAAWLAAFASIGGWLLSRPVPGGTRYDATQRAFTIPGSALPLALMMSIFFTKYGVAIASAIQPALKAEIRFVLAASVLYGLASGVFAGRAARLLRVALAHDKAGDVGRTAAAVGEPS